MRRNEDFQTSIHSIPEIIQLLVAPTPKNEYNIH